jgi:hypothetical protein
VTLRFFHESVPRCRGKLKGQREPREMQMLVARVKEQRRIASKMPADGTVAARSATKISACPASSVNDSLKLVKNQRSEIDGLRGLLSLVQGHGIST